MTVNLPSKFATVDVSFGSGEKHLWSSDPESLTFHADEQSAREWINSTATQTKMVAMLQVVGVYKAKPVELEVVAA